jgi:hypothetical protein
MDAVRIEPIPIEVGYSVYSMEGQLLGKVWEITSADFLLQPLGAAATWLMRDCIGNVTENHVTLILASSEVPSFVIEAPRG